MKSAVKQQDSYDDLNTFAQDTRLEPTPPEKMSQEDAVQINSQEKEKTPEKILENDRIELEF